MDGTDRWLRYCARGPFDTDCGTWLWGNGFGRSSHTRLAARGIAPRHLCWQFDISTRSRHYATLCSGSSSTRGGEQASYRCFYAELRANVAAAHMTPASNSGCAVAWGEAESTDAIADPRWLSCCCESAIPWRMGCIRAPNFRIEIAFCFAWG